jgi:hypothetical protein
VIRYSLICGRAHEFEAWFRDIATFDDEAADGSLTCPYCRSTNVQKRVMAPHVARVAREIERKPVAADRASPPDDRPSELRENETLRENVLAATEDVGERFPQEARRIHDSDSSPRAIRGCATLAEAAALIDEGAVLPLPGEGH